MTPVDAAKGLVRVHNRHFFTNLDRYECTWTLRENGRELESGSLGCVDVAPGERKDLRILYTKPIPAAEVLLTVRFRLPNDTAWAPAGHVVAWDQMAVREGSPGWTLPEPAGALNLETREDVYALPPHSWALDRMRRGEVWWGELAGDAGFRPVVIVSRSAGLDRRANITVAEVTRVVRDLPCEVPLHVADGMPRGLCGQHG